MLATEKQGQDAHTDKKFGLSDKAAMEIMKLFFAPDEDLYNKRINMKFLMMRFLIPISGFIGRPCLLKIGIHSWKMKLYMAFLHLQVVCLISSSAFYPLQSIRIYDFADGQVSGIFWRCFPSILRWSMWSSLFVKKIRKVAKKIDYS